MTDLSPETAARAEEAPALADPSGVQLDLDPGTGLTLTSADGRFGLNVTASVQGRFTMDRENEGPTESDVTIRRARLNIGGHLLTPDLRWKLQFGFAPSDLGMGTSFVGATAPAYSPILDAYLEVRALRDLEVRVGQFKVASNRERITSSAELQLVDRSVLNAEFTLDRDVGIELRSRDFLGADRVAYRIGVFSGHGRDARGLDSFDLMYLARVDVTPFGRFEDFSETDFERGRPRLSIGAGYGYIDHGVRDHGSLGAIPSDQGTTNTHHGFADMMFKFEGLSVLAELAVRDGRRNPGHAVDSTGAPMPVAAPRDGWGLNVQAGYLFPWLPLELAGRYATVRGEGVSSLGTANELTAGASYYLKGHAYKLQADYSRLWSDAISTGGDRVRVQVQLSF